jgi:fluoride exporter
VSGATWLVFLLAAAIGASSRYLVDAFVRARVPGGLPWGTFIVNASGCLALGVLAGFGLYHGLGSGPRTALGTGGLGAYTTFSTFTFETVRLAEEGDLDAAVRNVLLGLVGGLVAASAGIALAAVV